MGERLGPKKAVGGQRLPYQEVVAARVDPGTGTLVPLPPGETGTIAIRGGCVFPGYVVGRDADGPVLDASGKVVDGWLDTGDLGSVTFDGWVRLVGRAKDVIIRGGHNIDPAPIEELLYQHPAVAVAALVGQPDAYAGELPVAYVELKAGHQATPAELIHYLRERTPERAAVPVDLHLVQPMPLTAVGKIFKPALRVDAIGRVATQLLQGKAPAGCTFAAAVLPHPAHGHVIEVRISGADPALKQACEVAVHDALDPLTTRHVVAWQ